MKNIRLISLLAAGIIVISLAALYLRGLNRPAPKAQSGPPRTESGAYKFTNRLAGSTSPYLLQHAHNPVDWHEWGEEAFEKAREENKPIFLSVGYSTCHWCHVMERESFDNEEISALMNEHFINIKLDREERPDVDRVYMTYVQATTGSGGWPMSVWLTPDLKPFLGGTYFPPEDRYGLVGFPTILKRVANAWKNQRMELIASSESVTRQLRAFTQVIQEENSSLGQGLLDQGYEQIKSTYEPRHGGFGSAPKFPRPVALGFMFRRHAATGTGDALEMALHTLRKMAKGGIHDHLGGGFHRYSVDDRWHVPHFEKMLYDQAQLVWAYLEAYQITNDEFFANVAEKILAYVSRDLTGKQGQFYSAEDADSALPENPEAHAEGAFYVWGHEELIGILGKEAGSVFNFAFGAEKKGNVREDPHHEFTNKNILPAVDSSGIYPEQNSHPG
jgi:uncharacterized protein